MGHPPHPVGMSPMPGVAPHPAYLNGLRGAPWFGIPSGYPLSFHPGALAAAAHAHPYLLAATTPHVVAAPMANVTQSSMRAHHDLLKLQAASMQMNGEVLCLSHGKKKCC